MGSLLVHAFSLLSLSFSLFTLSSLIFLCLSSLLSLLSISLFSVFFSYSFLLLLLFPLVYCARLRPFYTICCDRIYHFTPQLLLTYCGCPSWTSHWSAGYPATTITLCWPCHTSFPNKSSFVLFSYFPWCSHPDKGWVSLLLTPIACT